MRARIARVCGRVCIVLVAVGAAAAVPVTNSYAQPGPVGAASTRAQADFNGDGRADLAIGVPSEDIGSLEDAGVVHVVYAGSGGLHGPGQLWHQDSPGVPGAAEAFDGFGTSLAIGDFDGDGYKDLAIGVPFEDFGSTIAGGMVQVLYGGPSGLTTTGVQDWHQDKAGVAGTAEDLDLFGSALTAGDFDGDGKTDLAIGVAFEDLGSVSAAGEVQILYGSSPNGLTATGSQEWHQDKAGVAGTAEAGDGFGDALTTGDFDGDGKTDLAIGVPFENIGSLGDAGVVEILYGSSPNGLTATGSQEWHQDKAGVASTAEAGDEFGFSLTASDFDADGETDLAIGVPFENIGSLGDAGVVEILYGSSPNGLTATGSQEWHQDKTGVAGTAEAGDVFGFAVAAADFNGDGKADLAVGVPGENQGGGAVQVLTGSSPNGLFAKSPDTLLEQGSWIDESQEADDEFGRTLATGDFNSDGKADLAIGVPGEDIGLFGNPSAAGVVHTLYGRWAAGLTATGNQLWRQGYTLGDNDETDDEVGVSLAAG